MIRQPKIGQEAIINYGDKTRSNCFIAKKDMPFQGTECEILAVGKGPGPRNVMVIITHSHHYYGWQYEIIPKGNLVAI